MLSGCSKNDLNFDKAKVLSIKIISANTHGISEDTTIINDRVKINAIITCINSNHKEPVKFIPKYKLYLNYENSIVPIVINGSSVSVGEGTKYKLKCDIETIIKNMIQQ